MTQIHYDYDALKATMLKSSLCNYSDAYVFVRGRITATGAGTYAGAREADKRNKGVIFKNCAQFTYYISEINNTQIDHAKDLDVVILIYNLIEHNYSKTSGSLWQYYRDQPHKKPTRNNPADRNTKNLAIAVPLKYLNNFWKTLEMPFIHCEINFILTWSWTCIITNSTGAGVFAIADTKLYVLAVTSSNN